MERMKWLFVLLFTLACTGAGVLWIWKERKYRVADQMTLPVVEYSSAEYPEDPALHALLHNRYKGRVLRLVRKAPGRFDFNFESTNRNVARVSFKDIDVTLFTPRAPEWARRDAGLTRIALVDREWNRQQVAFPARSPHLEVSGGDGVERQRLFSAELANNCLNAGLWEVLLFVEENGQKALYYQGWFTFPRGHYAEMFEANNAAPYRSWWRQMEHWVDPAGTPVNVDRLRAVVAELPERITPHPDESVFAAGEQQIGRAHV